MSLLYQHGKMERNLLLILLFIASIHHEVAASKIDSKIMQHSECGIYLAESTIPGAGLGMFAGDRDYKKGEGLTYGDLMVPLFELDWHNEGHDYDVSSSLTFVWSSHFLVENISVFSVPLGRVHLGCRGFQQYGRGGNR